MPAQQSQDRSAANAALIRRMMTALGHNDMRPLVDALDDNVRWLSHSPASYFRWGGAHPDRGGVLELLAKLSSMFAFRKMAVDKIVADGDEVWAICDFEAYHPASDKTVTGRNVLRATFKNGKLTSYEGFFDTLSALLQLGVEMPLPPR